MSKFLLHHDLRYLLTTENNDGWRIRAHYEQLSEFERGRIIGLKEAVSANRRIVRHMGRSDADKNRWTEANFSAMMVAVVLGSQQIARTN
ncbi:hypothetical protein TNCV_4157351 [Trichonephila clavipes]|nr:hypothetical protein TNCV_4157351 [Trichonephila clavipes]